MTETKTNAETTSIKAFSQTEAALAVLRERYAGIKYEVATAEGMALAKAGRKELRGYRTSLEKARKTEKEDALRLCQTIDSEARWITDELRALEDPIAAQIQAEDDRIEAERQAKIEAEEQRVADLMARIADIRNAVDTIAWDAPSRDIGAVITRIADTVIDESFAEFTQQAEDVKAATLARLRDMRDAAKAREEDEARRKAEQAELEQRRAEEDRREEIRARVRGIRVRANIGDSAPSSVSRSAIDSVELIKIDDSFGEFQDDARDAKSATLVRLRELYAVAVEREQEESRRRAELEAQQKKQAEEQARIDAENKRLAEERAALEREQEAAREREAEAERKREAEAMAEAERKHKAEEAAKRAEYPGDQAVIDALIMQFGVTDEIARKWLAHYGRKARAAA